MTPTDPIIKSIRTIAKQCARAIRDRRYFAAGPYPASESYSRGEITAYVLSMRTLWSMRPCHPAPIRAIREIRG
jgi:hypothetical protein